MKQRSVERVFGHLSERAFWAFSEQKRMSFIFAFFPSLNRDVTNWSALSEAVLVRTELVLNSFHPDCKTIFFSFKKNFKFIFQFLKPEHDCM